MGVDASGSRNAVGGRRRHTFHTTPRSVIRIDLDTVDQVLKCHLAGDAAASSSTSDCTASSSPLSSFSCPTKCYQKNTNSRAKRRKFVTIAKYEAVVHEVGGIHDYSQSEVEATWFSRQEFDDIKSSYRSLINQMRIRKDHHMTQALDNDDVSSTRGLECQSKAGSQLRKQIQMQAMAAVFDEQERHRRRRRRTIDDDDYDLAVQAIAIAYRQCSYHSQQAALNMGRKDEYAIAYYYRPSSSSEIAMGSMSTMEIVMNQSHEDRFMRSGMGRWPSQPMVGQQHHQVQSRSSGVDGRSSNQPRRHLNLGLSGGSGTGHNLMQSVTANTRTTATSTTTTTKSRRAAAA